MINRRLHPAWIAALVTFFTLVATSGFRVAPSVLILPLQSAFGWSRASISSAISINVLVFGLTVPFAAALMERFGIRRVVMFALAIVGTGAWCTQYINRPWHLMLLWGLSHLVTRNGWKSVSITVVTGAFLMVPVIFFFLTESPLHAAVKPYGAPDNYQYPEVVHRNAGREAIDILVRASKVKNFSLFCGSGGHDYSRSLGELCCRLLYCWSSLSDRFVHRPANLSG